MLRIHAPTSVRSLNLRLRLLRPRALPITLNTICQPVQDALPHEAALCLSQGLVENSCGEVWRGWLRLDGQNSVDVVAKVGFSCSVIPEARI